MDGQGTARILARFWFLTVAVLAIAVLYLAKVLFLPLAFSILFAFLLAPVVGLLERLHLPRSLAAATVILGFGAILAGAAWLLFTQLVSIANDLPIYRDNITEKIEAFHTPSDSAIGRAQEEVGEFSEELGLANFASGPTPQSSSKSNRKPLGSTPDHPVQVREVARPSGRLDQLSGVAEAATTTFLAVVFTFFVILQREDLRNRLIRLSGEHNLTMMTHAMNDASARISRYFRLQLLVNLGFGSLVAGVLSFIGLPHALLFGALAALSRFIPYFGALTAALLPTLLSLAVFQGWTHSIEVLCTFLFLEIFTANYVEPRIYGRHTGLTALAILVAAAFWTLIWGPVGLVLSMPLTVCLVVIGRHVPSLEFLTVMLGDRPAIPPPTCFYQRLLARDEREAAEILDSCLKGDTLENIYDKVLLPALLMSVRDREQGELSDSTISFVHQTARELIEELAFRERSNAEPAPFVSATKPPARVFCVPLRDDTDELGAIMLAKLLDSDRIHAVALPVPKNDEALTTAAKENPELIFLSGLPPFAVARAHRMVRVLRARNPNLKVMLGFWGSTEDGARTAEKFARDESFPISTTLAEAVTQVRVCLHLEEGELQGNCVSEVLAS
ncbi:MAG TPA: AI-2E family transporter [Terracidiphilus sp.]|nr:AI-2E family transporter [Terracidiphilus sp.]